MTPSLAEVRAAVDREWRRFGALLASADAAAWSRPTRLEGWTVGDLAAHVVWGVSMEADALWRRRTGADGRAAGRTVADPADREAVAADLDAAWAVLAEEVSLLGEADLATTAPLPYGDVPVAVFAQILAMEAGVHASDLAAALGEVDTLPGDVARASEAVLRVFLPVVAATAAHRPPRDLTVALRGPEVHLRFSYRDGRWEAADAADGPEPDACLDGDDSTLVLFALGRLPATDPRLSIAGDEEAARRFKSWLPGL